MHINDNSNTVCMQCFLTMKAHVQPTSLPTDTCVVLVWPARSCVRAPHLLPEPGVQVPRGHRRGHCRLCPRCRCHRHQCSAVLLPHLPPPVSQPPLRRWIDRGDVRGCRLGHGRQKAQGCGGKEGEKDLMWRVPAAWLVFACPQKIAGGNLLNRLLILLVVALGMGSALGCSVCLFRAVGSPTVPKYRVP